jgi:hypothetical protein
MAFDKKLFILAGIGVLLSGMKKATTTSNSNAGSGGGHEGTPGPGVQTPDPIGGAITGAVGSGISAGAAAGLAALKAALATTTAAGGADAGIATTTAGAAHEGAAAGGFIGGSQPGAAGGAASGGVATGGALAGLSAASIAVVAVYVVVVVVVIIVTAIFAMNMKLKTAIGELTRRSVDDLHAFELDLFSKIRSSLDVAGDFQEVDVADMRLQSGQRATFAYRPAPVKRSMQQPSWMGGDSPSVAILRMMKQIRAMSLEYVTYRARLLDNMGNGFYPDLYEHGFATNDVGASFNVSMMRITDFSQDGPAARAARISKLPPADWGGFESFPLLDGQTLYSVAHPESLSYGRPTGNQWAPGATPREWNVARDASPDTAFVSSPLGTRLLQAARLKALGDVMSLFPYDPTVVFVWEPYARLIVNRLGINDVAHFYPASPSEPWNGWTFYTDPAFFGAQVAFDVWEIRVPAAGAPGATSRMMKRNAGVPLGDKRLGATWLAD